MGDRDGMEIGEPASVTDPVKKTLLAERLRGQLSMAEENEVARMVLGAPPDQIKELDDFNYPYALYLATQTGAPDSLIANFTLDNLGTIIQRLEEYATDIDKTIRVEELDMFGLGLSILGLSTRAIESIQQSGQKHTITQENLERLYLLTRNADSRVRHFTRHYIPTLINCDLQRRKEDELSVEIADRIRNDMITTLSTESIDDREAEEIVYTAERIGHDYIENLFAEVMRHTSADAVFERSLVNFSNVLGFEKVRQLTRREANKSDSVRDMANRVEKSLGLAGGEEFFTDLRDLYAQLAKEMDFDDYKPNVDLNNFELKLLGVYFRPGQNVVDIGSGGGRLLLGLKKIGVNVFGIDFVHQHTKETKQKDVGANVAVASWDKMPFPSRAADGAYILGRSFTHNTTVEDGIRSLIEAGRVLGEKGVLIVDLPDPEVGQIAASREGLENKLKTKGVSRFLKGYLIDSPDSRKYYDRLVPFPRQFQAMAALADFNAEIVERMPYESVSGQKNVDLYWKLVKRDMPLTKEERVTELSYAHLGDPDFAPFNLFWRDRKV